MASSRLTILFCTMALRTRSLALSSDTCGVGGCIRRMCISVVSDTGAGGDLRHGLSASQVNGVEQRHMVVGRRG